MAGVRRQRNSGFVLLTGIKELDALLRKAGPKVGNAAARSGLTKGVRLAVKLMKKQTTDKSVKKALGGNVKRRTRGGNKGLITANAGAAVGKKQPKQTTNPSGGPGVGIGARNVHWYILGTKERIQQTTGRATGRMPANDLVVRAIASGRGAITKVIAEGSKSALERGLAKLRAKGRL